MCHLFVIIPYQFTLWVIIITSAWFMTFSVPFIFASLEHLNFCLFNGLHSF